MKQSLNQQCEAVFEHAYQIATELNNNYLGSEHILLGILHDPTIYLTKLLAKKGITYAMVYDDCRILFGMKDKVQFLQEKTLIVNQIMDNIDLKQKSVNVDTLSEALLTLPCSVAIELLARYSVDCKELIMELKEKNCFYFIQECKELNLMNKNEGFVGRNDELFQLMTCLGRKEKANVILVGDAGVGKTAIVERLADKIDKKQVSQSLQSCVIVELNLTSLVANTKYRGDFEDKIQRILEQINQNPNIILFIDEIHLILGAGKAEGSLDVASILKPALARGQFKCIGATTPQELERLEKDQALSRRFQKIKILEPSCEETWQMLLGKKHEYEQFHDVTFTEDFLHQLLNYTETYLPQYKNPDKSLDCLDLTCSITKFHHHKSCTLDFLKQSIQSLAGFPCFENNEIFDMIQQWNQTYHINLKTIISQKILLIGQNHQQKINLIKQVTHTLKQELLILNCLCPEECFDYVLSEIKRAPFSCVHIENYNQANASIKKKVDTMLSQGYMLFKNERIHFKNALIFMSLQGENRDQTLLEVGFKQRSDFLCLQEYFDVVCRMDEV